MTREIDQITNHIQLALDRSAQEYKEKTRHEGFITAFTQQIQDLEDAVFGLIDGRRIATATGHQLDKLGEIVDLDRGNYDDDYFRILLYVKIGQNTSHGDAPKIINIFKLLMEASLVHYINLGRGSVQLASDVCVTNENIDFIYDNMQLVVSGGIRIDHIVCFDPDEPFAFAGNNTTANAAGFSDITGTTGGKFAKLLRRQKPFAFAGNDIDPRGFGSLEDPILGGNFVGIGG